MNSLGEEQIKSATSACHGIWAGKYHEGRHTKVAERPWVQADLFREALNDR